MARYNLLSVRVSPLLSERNLQLRIISPRSFKHVSSINPASDILEERLILDRKAR